MITWQLVFNGGSSSSSEPRGAMNRVIGRGPVYEALLVFLRIGGGKLVELLEAVEGCWPLLSGLELCMAEVLAVSEDGRGDMVLS